MFAVRRLNSDSSLSSSFTLPPSLPPTGAPVAHTPAHTQGLSHQNLQLHFLSRSQTCTSDTNVCRKKHGGAHTRTRQDMETLAVCWHMSPPGRARQLHNYDSTKICLHTI